MEARNREEKKGKSLNIKNKTVQLINRSEKEEEKH